jgi:hypothetical protein
MRRHRRRAKLNPAMPARARSKSTSPAGPALAPSTRRVFAALALAASVTAASRPTRAQAPAPPATPSHQPDARRILVHIDGAPAAMLQMASNGDDSWTTVCTGSCDALLPVGRAYRIDGDGIRRSGEFQLQPSLGDRLTLDVNPASSARFAWGVALVPIGAATIATGLAANFMAGIGSAGGSDPNGEPGPPNYTPGTVLIVAGAVMILGGVCLFLHDWATTVQPSNAQPVRELSPPQYPDGGWRERSPEERAFPTATITPLWALRF